MRKFVVSGKGVKSVLTEAQIVRMGHKQLGTVGLIESISQFKDAGLTVTTLTGTLAESVLTEGFFDVAKEKLSGALNKVKQGLMSEDEFDKMYTQMQKEGKVKPSGMASNILKNRTATSGSSSVRGMGDTRQERPLSMRNDSPKSPAQSQKSTMTTEQIDQKKANYRKMFSLDVSKYKKMLEIAPEMVDEFKQILDGIVGARDKQYSDLAN